MKVWVCAVVNKDATKSHSFETKNKEETWSRISNLPSSSESKSWKISFACLPVIGILHLCVCVRV